MRWRGKTAKVRANREKAPLSSIWNFARESGYTSLANPCAGINGFKETGRDVYVEAELLAKVYAKTDQPLRDTLDLFYLTGQRVTDTLQQGQSDPLKILPQFFRDPAPPLGCRADKNTFCGKEKDLKTAPLLDFPAD